MQEIAVFEPNPLIILLLFIDPDILKFLLEIQGISHLVKQECDKKVAPGFIEFLPAFGLPGPHRFDKHVALRWYVTGRSRHSPREIEQGMEPVLFGILLDKCTIVFVIGVVIEGENYGV